MVFPAFYLHPDVLSFVCSFLPWPLYEDINPLNLCRRLQERKQILFKESPDTLLGRHRLFALFINRDHSRHINALVTIKEVFLSLKFSVVYYSVTLDVEDPDGVLLPGMTAQVEVTTSDKPGALALPIAALKTNSKGAYVLLAQPDGSTTEQQVTTGIYSDEYVEIVDGLSEGDEVVNSYKATGKKASGAGAGQPRMGGGGRMPRM